MQIDSVKIPCKEDVHICHTNFAKKMERNSHERTSLWKMYGKRLFFEDLEVQDARVLIFIMILKFIFGKWDLHPKGHFTCRAQMGAAQNLPNFYQLDCSELLKWAQGLCIGTKPLVEKQGFYD
jgi:hypothetical protein